MTKTEENKLLNTVERHRFQDELRHKATKQGCFDAEMWHLDHPIPGTDVYLAPSDHGESAEKMYAALEEAPLWQKLYLRARRKLRPKQRAILDALLIDWRTGVAAKIAGVSRTYVVETKKTLVSAFADVYAAWKNR